MEFIKLNKQSLKEVFVRNVTVQILDKKIPAGTQLPTVREISEQMHVSRALVSEGLAELEKIGLLERKGKNRVVATLSRD